jgi:hypothetical protein
LQLVRPASYDPAVHINEDRLQKLSRAIVKAIVAQGIVKPKAPESQLVERIARIFVENLLEEQKIEEEAERMLDRLGRQAQGMDQRKILMGLKDRIAKEKGFSL